MYRVAAVCTGNICRSPIAEFMLAEAVEEAGLSDHVSVESFAVSAYEEGNPMDRRARSWLVDNEVGEREDIDAHISRPITAQALEGLSLALALDVEHLAELRALAEGFPDDPANNPTIRLIGSFNPELETASPEEQGIYDPWYGGPEDFDKVSEMIRACVPGVIEFIRHELAARAVLDVE
ncbi:low molecular weight protein-tyrosine-phosphatase [Falsarthrobacter nasiphocae]|uniref:protein-tyrosine-phosphatase n=1 Tax=Falsarthrobacter nasiphocae TaxID=189863 RepID=A0AAE3YHU2_9MICC|nr:low molecular weight protein-tyrosine-phosphatase [Falsarthrobacter nasiphocae]MDR6892301.1 protein-tyrosine phosphatase [Falsarthrobacter nasiphocae]